MKTLLLVMLILTACGGDEKKETPATQSTDATLIDMIITDIALSSIDMTAGNESDMVVESDSSIIDMATTTDMSTQAGDMSAQASDMSTQASDMASTTDMSVASDMVIVDMAVQTTDMASK